jgi:uncharacterized protein
MAYPCQKKSCIKCCTNTEMPLSEQDIGRIRSLGVPEQEFCLESPGNGWVLLRNVDGRCVFHDGSGCEIYGDRPEGCRLYPIVFESERREAILDDECPYRGEFLITEKDRRELSDLVTRIVIEGKERKKYRTQKDDIDAKLRKAEEGVRKIDSDSKLKGDDK